MVRTLRCLRREALAAGGFFRRALQRPLLGLGARDAKMGFDLRDDVGVRGGDVVGFAGVGAEVEEFDVLASRPSQRGV